MAFDVINVGASVNDGTGDTLRGGGVKINNNFAKATEGPSSSTAGGVAAFNGTSGKLLQAGLGDGSASSPTLTFASSTNTGMFRPASNTLGFSANGSERMRIASTGKITANAGTHWVGTVAETTASAVIEFGSNANGRYVRYPDGTQICWQRATFVDHTNPLSSSTRLSGNWTFPIAFIAATSYSAFVSLPVHVSGNFTGCDRLDIVTFGPGAGFASNIDISVFFTGGVSTVNASIANIQAAVIGRWY
jgi:hypothetical protein